MTQPGGYLEYTSGNSVKSRDGRINILNCARYYDSSSSPLASAILYHDIRGKEIYALTIASAAGWQPFFHFYFFFFFFTRVHI